MYPSWALRSRLAAAGAFCPVWDRSASQSEDGRARKVAVRSKEQGCIAPATRGRAPCGNARSATAGSFARRALEGSFAPSRHYPVVAGRGVGNGICGSCESRLGAADPKVLPSVVKTCVDAGPSPPAPLPCCGRGEFSDANGLSPICMKLDWRPTEQPRRLPAGGHGGEGLAST